jgi:hypothetical protein
MAWIDRHRTPGPGAEYPIAGRHVARGPGHVEAGEGEVDKEGADRAQPETIYLVPGMEYTFVA